MPPRLPRTVAVRRAAGSCAASRPATAASEASSPAFPRAVVAAYQYPRTRFAHRVGKHCGCLCRRAVYIVMLPCRAPAKFSERGALIRAHPRETAYAVKQSGGGIVCPRRTPAGQVVGSGGGEVLPGQDAAHARIAAKQHRHSRRHSFDSRARRACKNAVLCRLCRGVGDGSGADHGGATHLAVYALGAGAYLALQRSAAYYGEGGTLTFEFAADGGEHLCQHQRGGGRVAVEPPRGHYVKSRARTSAAFSGISTPFGITAIRPRSIP